MLSTHSTALSSDSILENEPLGVATIERSDDSKLEIKEKTEVVKSTNDPSIFEINEKIEVSQMANMFLGKIGVIICYLCMDIYLFGDLAIYSTTVPKSLMSIIW
ncbi:unnamed protein product [Strongylus vulgaris]|uniref:Uncharacterized protein n=1 Tax=Strongylus vulgaris TaxID=40348 RepID=A0A3P7J8N3_STRVU|nr:unnamed protein product [Strongylus vulgaris]